MLIAALREESCMPVRAYPFMHVCVYVCVCVCLNVHKCISLLAYVFD